MGIQKLLIRHILEPLAKLAERIPQKIRDSGFVLACLGIILQFFGRNSGQLQYRYLIFYAIGCLCLGLMILFALKSGLKPVKFKWWLILPWMGIGGFMLLSGVLYSVDYLPEAVLFLVAYPVAFIVWNNTDGQKIIKLLFRSLEISFVICLVVSCLFYPVEEARYSALFNNLNGAAGYLALVAVCLLVECLWSEKITGAFVRKLVFLGVCLALLLYTSSRTGLLEVVVVAVTAVVLGFIRLRKRKKLFFIRNIALIALSVLLFFQVTIYAFQFVYTTSRTVYSSVEGWFKAEDGSGNSAAEDPVKPTQPVVRPEDSAAVTNDRLNSGDKSTHEISSGRSAIWKGYLKQLNLLGHPDTGTVMFKHDGVQKVYHTTHMTILQVAYENGIIAGVLYLVFNLTAGIYSVVYALRRRDDPWAMVPLLISVAYGVHSLLASTGISFWYMSTLFYYLLQFPLMVHLTEKQNKKA